MKPEDMKENHNVLGGQDSGIVNNREGSSNDGVHDQCKFRTIHNQNKTYKWS